MSSQPDEFERGLLACAAKLKSFAVKLCRNEARAEDLVQETFMRALKNRKSFAEGTNLDAWLFTICKNLFRSDIRKHQREVEDADGEIAKRVPFEDSPLKKMEVAELLGFVDKMPDQFRIPLRLIADGATYEEAALEMVEQVGTIKSRVNRGREFLKKANNSNSSGA